MKGSSELGRLQEGGTPCASLCSKGCFVHFSISEPACTLLLMMKRGMFRGLAILLPPLVGL